MLEKNQTDTYMFIYNELGKMFPNARCELDYRNLYELLIAVVLSAQTTDVAVNLVTPELFKKYPSFKELKDAKYDDVVSIIKRIGLYKNKAKNIINLSKKIFNEKNGVVVCDSDYLITLPGVGRKTSNVILSEGFKVPRIAVDTHVLRVSNRLGIVNSDNVVIVEEELMRIYPKNSWCELHLRLLFFGRYFCTAKKPNCLNCPFVNICINKDDKK